jgi:hypothetical protein
MWDAKAAFIRPAWPPPDRALQTHGMGTLVLTPQELEGLTSRKRPRWQARELRHLLIPFKTRTDGSLIVFWDDVRPRHELPPKKREPQIRIA